MNIQFEGKPYEVPDGLSLAELLDQLHKEVPARILLRRNIMKETYSMNPNDPPRYKLLYVDEKFVDLKDFAKTIVAPESKVEPFYFEAGG
jgi:hypothetical protein